MTQSLLHLIGFQTSEYLSDVAKRHLAVDRPEPQIRIYVTLRLLNIS